MTDWSAFADVLEEKLKVNIHNHHLVLPVTRPALVDIARVLMAELNPRVPAWIETTLAAILRSTEGLEAGSGLRGMGTKGELEIEGRTFKVKVLAKQSKAAKEHSYDASDEIFIRFDTPLSRHGLYIHLWITVRRSGLDTLNYEDGQAVLQIALGMNGPKNPKDRNRLLPKSLRDAIMDRRDCVVSWGTGDERVDEWKPLNDSRTFQATVLTADEVRRAKEGLLASLEGCGDRGLRGMILRLADLAEDHAGKLPPPPEGPKDRPAGPEVVRLAEQLKRRKQIILTGPPGTGKTWLAGEVARRYRTARTVTFHPSMAYEDFVEGLRPVIENDARAGGVQYTVEPGHFLRAVEDARDDPGSDHLLIIDEINRGNLARIFGELITMLERDKRATYDEAAGGWRLPAGCVKGRLAYSKKTLEVPDNLHLLGTMNTADRSIALMDFALRRRFHFHHLAPDFDVVRAVARREKKEPPELEQAIELFEELNKRIEVLRDHHHQVGHSYLIDVLRTHEAGAFEAAMDDCLVHQVVPLLEEYFFEDWMRLRAILGNGLVHRVEPLKNLPGEFEAQDEVDAKWRVVLEGGVYRKLLQHLDGKKPEAS